MFKKRERIYIIPTQFGLMYGAGIVLCLLIASTYANNLAYLLSFFMVAIFLVAMVGANSNLKGIELDSLKLGMGPEEGFASGMLWLKNNSRENRFFFQVKSKDINKKFFFDIAKIDAGSLSSKYFEFPLPSEVGVYKTKSIKIGSVFPLGLFYSWKQFKLEEEYIVFPRPEGEDALPETKLSGNSVSSFSTNQGEDFSGHRKFEIGESYHHVDWKAYARKKGLLLKSFEDGDHRSIEMQWTEDSSPRIMKLRQFSKWIEICNAKKWQYRLSIKNGGSTDLGLGETQREKTLSFLVKEIANENRLTK